MSKFDFNPLTQKLDLVNSAIDIATSTQLFHSFTGIAVQDNMYVKIADLTINLADPDYVGKEFVSVIDFIQHNTRPYQERLVPHRYGKLSVKINVIFLPDNAYGVESVLYDNFNIATSDITIVEMSTSNTEVQFAFYLKILDKYCRYFFSARHNTGTGIDFALTQNEAPEYILPFGKTQYNPELKDYCNCSLMNKETIIATADDEVEGSILIDNVILPGSTVIFKNGAILYPTQYVLNSPTNGYVQLDVAENDTITALYSDILKREDITVSASEETAQEITITNSFNTVFSIFKNGAILYPTQYTITNSIISLTISENDTITLLLI